MSTLKEAVDANLPLISVTTDDLINAVDTIAYILGETPKAVQAMDFDKVVSKGGLFYSVAPDVKDAQLVKAYTSLVKKGWSLIIINPTKPYQNVFDAGPLPVPDKLMRAQISAVVDDEEQVQKIMIRLGGVSLKDAAELLRLTMVRTGALTPQGIAHTRRALFRGQQGLFPVNTEQPLYLPSPELEEWFNAEKDYFLKATDQRLRPRGLLFDGPPGTGKSSGAKWLAEQIGVPLYMLSLASTKSKWTGESEAFLTMNLAKIEREAPCVVLFDEIEKVVGVNQDMGTTASMLSQLLWWLAEHRSRVLTIMTTNNVKAIPPELYRPGRIDKVLYVDRADKHTAFLIIAGLVKTFKMKDKHEHVTQIIQEAFMEKMLDKGGKRVAHAEITSFTLDQLKSMGVGL